MPIFVKHIVVILRRERRQVRWWDPQLWVKFDTVPVRGTTVKGIDEQLRIGPVTEFGKGQ